MKKLSFWILVILVGTISLMQSIQSQAAPAYQMTPFPTPTPGDNGRIIYTVQPGDTLWRVAAISGITVEELRSLNNIGANEVIAPGQALLLGLAGPSEAATPTAAVIFHPPTQTPTPRPGNGTLCILLYNDVNGDSIRQESEPGLADGVISVADRSGKVSITADTQESLDPVCFEDLPAEAYNISVAVPENYNPTTATNSGLQLEGGQITYMDFGAQAGGQAQQVPAPITESKSNASPIMGIIGAAMLLLGFGLGIFAWRSGKQSPK